MKFLARLVSSSLHNCLMRLNKINNTRRTRWDNYFGPDITLWYPYRLLYGATENTLQRIYKVVYFTSIYVPEEVWLICSKKVRKKKRKMKPTISKLQKINSFNFWYPSANRRTLSFTWALFRVSRLLNKTHDSSRGLPMSPDSTHMNSSKTTN